MEERTYITQCGTIHYWISKIDAVGKSDDPDALDKSYASKCTLVFLPGLTADHSLFEKQIEYFEGKVNVFVWDAPGHAASWPFDLSFDLMGKVRWLDEILTAEDIENPVIVGQSMGEYVGQAYSQLFPKKLKGFVSIDSAPLQRKYITAAELWMLKRTEPMYRYYPWKLLLKSGTKGVATSDYGRTLMKQIMMHYDGDQKRYAKLSGHGFRMVAEAIEADLPYEISCPALLICGEKDRAGSCIRYNKAWHKGSSIRLEWIRDAGHNSNTDAPEIVNSLFEEFLAGL